MQAPKVPFLDLVTPHQQLKDELAAVFDEVLETAGFVGGPLVAGFEQDFAASATRSIASELRAARMPCASRSWRQVFNRATSW